ncbi:diguanylate cyclase [Amphritea opalescens]|uniref:Diguanylate cyclase n=1 Tax=Amphritea opalescens TaxID=2490544 RepID=A0A430KVB8_9GAMM|nr:cache domain-containing protein [Amphritea opalescens]RTE67465.1 diguanylate cyclase [Amphritea opalescens]
MDLKREEKAGSTGLPTQLLWGGSFIVLLLLCSQTVYFYFNAQTRYQQQLGELQDKLIKEQHSRLSSELADAEQMIDQMFAEATDLIRQQTRSQTHQALALMNSLYQRYHEQLSEAEMKKMLIESLRDIRFFDDRGYYFIDDMDGTLLLSPILPGNEGTSLLGLRDDTRHNIFQGLVAAVSNAQKEGFSHYRWYAPDNNKVMRNKVAHVGTFEPYNWIVGNGDYFYRFEDDLKPRIYNALRNIHFGRTGYIALLDRDGRLLASGATPEREGFNYLNDPDPIIRQGAQQALATAQAGGGYLSYDWYQTEDASPSHRLSLVKPIEDRGWVLIAGIYQDEVNELFSSQEQRLGEAIKQGWSHQLIAIITIGILALLIALSYSRWLKSRFKRYDDNITQQQDKLREFAESLKLSALIVESAHEGVIVCDADNRIVKVNSAFTRITGYQLSEVLGKTPAILTSGLQDNDFYKEMWHTLNTEGAWRGEVWSKRKDGEVYPEWLSISVNRYSNGEVQNYIATFSDITHLKNLENKLRYLAETDPLTGLANRRTLMDCLNRDLAAQQRYHSAGVALFFIDLDRFKAINDCYGHDIGDSLLIEMSNRLKASLRESDLPCRVGGDEFILIIKFKEGKEGVKELPLLCQRLLNEMTKPLRLTGIDIDISCSMGVAVSSKDDDAYSLMKNADQALYKAKGEGRGCACFFDETISTTVYPSAIEVESTDQKD